MGVANLTEFYEAEIREERERQDEKWGQQNHPSVDPVLLGREGGCTPQRMAEEYEIPTATRARGLCQLAAERGQLTWAHILIEEVAEAIEAATSGDEDDTREELIQAEAVIRAWREYLDRSGS